MSARSRGVVSLLLWIVTAAVFAQQASGIVRRDAVPISGNDFPAFYCAGQALLDRADPYALEPLRGCEHALPNGSDLPAAFVTPAPLPPYALDLFALLAEVPYRTAAWIAFAILVASAALLALALSRVTHLPSGAIAAALLLSGGLASVVFGQIPVLVTLAVVLCGAALLRGSDAAAAACAAAATIEPHVGLPVAVALFFLRPGTRVWLAGFAAAAVAASVLAVTPATALHYVTTVLPEHARAELLTVDQFSLSHVLARAGVSDSTALLAGSLSSLLTLVLGVAAAAVASRRLGVAAIAYMPAAAALLAGPFVHQIQLVAALPAAFLCIARGTPAVAWAGRLAVAVVAAAPFTVALGHRPLIDAIALFSAGGALLGALLPEEPLAFVTALGSFVLAAACVAFPLAVEHLDLPATAPAAAPALAPNQDASENWGVYLRTDPRYASLQPDAEAAKTPVWLGLLVLLGATLVTGLERVSRRTPTSWDRRPGIHLAE